MKTAIILYGFLRTFKITAKSLLEKVAKPNNADIFIFSYENEGISIIKGVDDINKQKVQLGAKQDLEGDIITESILKNVYGDSLKKCSLQNYSEYTAKFIKDSKNIYSPTFPIERFFSLYFNITGVAKLLVDYENETGIKYDNIILTRPDLNFYSEIKLDDIDLDYLNIADYGGNIQAKDENELYYSCYYKNVERMEYIPYHSIAFSDQLIISKAENLRKLNSLYDNLQTYETYGLPVCHPETVLYYHLGLTQNLGVKTNDIKYEILRNNYMNAENEFTVKSNTNNSKKEKYKLKVKQDLINIGCGIKSIFGIVINIIKYFVK